MNYICNGLSESMKRDPYMKSVPYPLSEGEFVNLVNKGQFKSCIGHEELSDYLSRITGKKIVYNRCNINVGYDDVLLIVSVEGRLPKNPKNINYKGNLSFRIVRFEKQDIADIKKSQQVLNEITMEA